MRASTLFALTAAVLIGMGVFVAMRMSGFFAPTIVAQKVTAYPTVLVAAKNIFQDTAITAGDVKVRPLRADEMKSYESNKYQYLPPVPNAAAWRIAKVNIE